MYLLSEISEFTDGLSVGFDVGYVAESKNQKIHIGISVSYFETDQYDIPKLQLPATKTVAASYSDKN